MKDIWLKFLEATGNAFWIEVTTTTPACTYYFGPFSSAEEAEEACPGYVEDLQEEGAQNIRTEVKRLKPEVLTIEHSSGEIRDHGVSPVLSGQLS